MGKKRSVRLTPAVRWVVLGLTLAGLGSFAAGALARTRVYVSPSTGSARTRFVMRFRAPERTGRIGPIRRTDRLYATGPTATGCVAGVRLTLPPVSRGAHVRITVRPRPGTRWCAGLFHARIVRTESPVCAGTCVGVMIPAPRTIARFSFRVRRPAGTPTPTPPTPGGAPSFAGIKTATLCDAGAPQLTSPSRAYTLGWDAATDPSTPSNQIVYEIYYSPTSGGENFSSPVVTTAAGQTSYSGTVPGSGSAYFVVRARDGAGREDTNRVQKLAVNIC